MASRFRRLLDHAARVGPLCLAIGLGLSAVGLAAQWSLAEYRPSLAHFMVHLTVVPFGALVGAAIGFILLPLVQCVASLLRINRNFWPLSHTMLTTAVTSGVGLAWAAWVAGSVSRALEGRGGVHIPLAVAAFAGLLGGLLFGWAMRRYDQKISQDE